MSGPAAGAPAPPEFVGSAACGRCHAAEARAFAGSDHARAMAPAGAGTVRGDFAGARLTHDGVTSTFLTRGGRHLVRTEGPGGQPGEFPVAYTLGVDPLQQYLVPWAGGRLQALGLAWDTRPGARGGQRWIALEPVPRLAPSDPRHWTGRDQTWNFQCAECHVTDVRKRYDAAGDRYATAWAELGVGCEACHGPGSAHVAWAAARASAAPPGGGGPRAAGLLVPLGRRGVAWTVRDPARGTAERRGPPGPPAEIDACARCHARRQPIVDPYPYGRPLLDTHVPALLEAGLYHADGQIRGEVYEYGSFLQSRMHRAGVTCSDCHEPHAGTLRAPGDLVCAGCHAPARFEAPGHHRHRAGSEGARCVSCHMPARTYMVVDPRRDHAFRVPRPDLSAELGTPDACTACHRDRTARWAADRVTAWRAGDPPADRLHPPFARALDAGRRGLPGAGPLLAALARDRRQPGIARATALALLPEFLTAGGAPAVEAALHDEEALVRMAAVGVLDARPDPRSVSRAAPLLRDPVRAVRLAAARALAGTEPGLLTAAQEADLARAVSEAIAAERVNADRPEARVNLAGLHLRLGRPAEAEAELRAALRLAPRFAPAVVRLAELLHAQGRPGEGERLLEQAVRDAPSAAEPLRALGLVRARQARWPEALALLHRASAAEPRSPRLAHVYAVALHTAGRAGEAIAVLEAAHRLRPASREVLSALAAYLAERGDVGAALSYAERWLALAPDDPEAQALVATLRGRARPP